MGMSNKIFLEEVPGRLRARRSSSREGLLFGPSEVKQETQYLPISIGGLAFCQHCSHLTLTTPHEIQSAMATSQGTEEGQG